MILTLTIPTQAARAWAPLLAAALLLALTGCSAAPSRPAAGASAECLAGHALDAALDSTDLTATVRTSAQLARRASPDIRAGAERAAQGAWLLLLPAPRRDAGEARLVGASLDTGDSPGSEPIAAAETLDARCGTRTARLAELLAMTDDGTGDDTGALDGACGPGSIGRGADEYLASGGDPPPGIGPDRLPAPR